MGAGLVGGLILAWRSRNGEPLPPEILSEREELLRQRDGYYESIRNMELEKPRMDPEAWNAEKQRLEVEAAKVLLALHQLEAKEPPPPPRKESVGSRHPQLVGAAWGAGIVLFFGALYLGLQENTKPRDPNGSVTGNAQTAAPAEEGSEKEEPLSPEEEEALAKLKAAAEAAPDDAKVQNAYAHALVRVNKLMDGWRISEAVVAKDPNNIEARTHQAIVLVAINESETAAGLLDKVLQMDPKNTEALAYRGLLYLRAGSPDKAIETWNASIAVDPGQEQLLRPLINMAKNPSSLPTQGPAEAAAGPAITGTIQADPSVAATVPPGTVMFVFARPAGATGGMPLAAKRIPVDKFPVSFSLSSADSPMGGSLSGALQITARIDRDGNPSTHDPNDLEGLSPSVEAGATGVVITLGESAGSTSAGSAAAGSGATGPSSAPAATSAPGAGGGISGTLDAPGQKLPPGSTIFVYARSPGQERGMPLAVTRLSSSTFPVSFQLGAGDSPMGGGITGPVVITARVDGDGNPATHDPSDLEGRSGTVEPGATGVAIRLAPSGG